MTTEAPINPKKNVRRADSKTQQRIASRTRENMRPDMFARRDKFVEGLLLGLPKRQAALYAGVPLRTCNKEGVQLWGEPYVQERFRELRQKLEEKQLLDHQEIILGLKSQAYEDGPDSSHGARVGAWGQLAKIHGLTEKAPNDGADMVEVLKALIAKLPD